MKLEPVVTPLAEIQAVSVRDLEGKRVQVHGNVYGEKDFNPLTKHAIFKNAVSPKYLRQIFPDMKRHWKPADLSYGKYKRWNLSCYCEVWEGWTPKTPPHPPMAKTMEDTLSAAKEIFEKWYAERNGLEKVDVITMNSFVTRYSPAPGQDELGKHVDGRKVDGSLILALPTDEPFDWPGLKVWDGPKGNKSEYTYPMSPGDIACLDNMVWHHALPITSGRRYALVCFYKCKWIRAKMPTAENKSKKKNQEKAKRVRSMLLVGALLGIAFAYSSSPSSRR